ncbi:putative PAS sensor signal transduction histidine kinase [Methanocella conradii HZ254]|uniref:histidine kinase n=1 Tax=Methanocella conradii (strain DSM 24694 / JCM 17849 / CGMCC 1.5162 / HZ254) TaxID=1041930 RepID=H8I774_METCZ|nr:PAS domain-containing sensor histidine kinase [Methanocella conradii]AFD00325.1 putative PAS sensor signal transduction histidine kinase [Methanocella conradii HZ254]
MPGEYDVQEGIIKGKKEDDFWKRVFDSIHDGISIIDRDYNIICVNSTMERWHSDMLPLAGKKCYYAYHGRHMPCEHCPGQITMKERKTNVSIIPSESPMVGWREVNSFPLIDDSGEVQGIIYYIRDITERKRAEEALQETKAQAELYVDLMGHDINNLNQVGMGFLELALDTLDLDEQGRSILSSSLRALESSTRLIDNVKKLQKVKSGKLQRYVVDLGKTLELVKENYSHMPGSNVTINYSPVSNCYVMANELLYDVFANIVSNAIKYAVQDPVIDITIKKAYDGDNFYYKVAVEDNGPGIPDELKARLFKRQLGGDKMAKGSGIGLYLVKTLVNSYHGRVWAEDRVYGDRSKGSRFVVMLPATHA